MARFLTMLTFALVTATQTAQAFPHIRNYGFSQAGRHDRSESVRLKETNGLRGSVTVNFLDGEDSYEDVLEVIAEEDPELAYMLLLDSGCAEEEALELLFGERQPFMPNTADPANEMSVGAIDIPRHRFTCTREGRYLFKDAAGNVSTFKDVVGNDNTFKDAVGNDNTFKDAAGN